MNKTNEFVNVGNARLEDQKRVMEEILAAGHCPFCPDHLFKYHKKPILKETRFWVLTLNQWPYSDTSLHFLVIHKQHVEMPGDVKPGAFQELRDLWNWVVLQYRIESGALCLRFGGMGAATVKHLHAHIIVPDQTKPENAIVRFKVG